MTYEQILLIIYIAYLLIASVVAFALYKKDKAIAVKQSGDRIKEKILLEASVLGGGIGAFIGRKVCHHKTDKKYFSFTIYLSILLQLLVLVLMVVLAIRG